MAAGARGTRRSGELGAFVVIGVIANAEDHGVVREFFELFKTPWEFLREDGIYDVVLCAGDFQPSKTAKLIIVYAGRKTKHDVQAQTAIPDRRLASRRLVYGVDNFPIYGSVISFAGGQGCLLKDNDSGSAWDIFKKPEIPRTFELATTCSMRSEPCLRSGSLRQMRSCQPSTCTSLS